MIGSHSKYAAQVLKKKEEERLKEERRQKEEWKRKQDEFECHLLIFFFKLLFLGVIMYGLSSLVNFFLQ